jgi:hypothetical protein
MKGEQDDAVRRVRQGKRTTKMKQQWERQSIDNE